MTIRLSKNFVYDVLAHFFINDVVALSKYAIVSENRLTLIPTTFDMRTATLFGCAITTAFGVVNNDAQIKLGESVVIFGIGGLGVNIAQAAEMVSAYPIVGVDRVDYKLEMGKNFMFKLYEINDTDARHYDG